MSESVAVCSLIKSYFYDPTPEELAENCVKKARPGDKYFGMSKESILGNWNERKEEGIRTHKSIEKNFEDSGVCEYIKSYISIGFKKFDEVNISLQTKKYLIKGRADCVLINDETKQMIVCEWKNCRYYNIRSDDKGFGPCENLYNTKFTKHILQSEFYKRLLENKYNDYEIRTEVIYIYDNKIEKIIQPYYQAISAVDKIITDLNK